MPTIGAYVSDEEFIRVSQIADEQHTTKSQVVGKAVKGVIVEDKTPMLELINELKSIGNNINQIAKIANTKKALDRQSLESLLRIETELENLL